MSRPDRDHRDPLRVYRGARPLLRNEVVVLMSSADITRLYRAEQRLRALEESQALVARLRLRALSCTSAAELAAEACRLVADRFAPAAVELAIRLYDDRLSVTRRAGSTAAPRHAIVPASDAELRRERCISAALIVRGRSIGALSVFANDGSFTEDDADSLHTVAEVLAGAVDREQINLGLELERAVAKILGDPAPSHALFEHLFEVLLRELRATAVGHWRAGSKGLEPTLLRARDGSGRLGADEAAAARISEVAALALEKGEPACSSSFDGGWFFAVPIMYGTTPASAVAFFVEEWIGPAPPAVRSLLEMGRAIGICLERAEMQSRQPAARQLADEEQMITLGHELRNPLAAIRNAIDLLRPAVSPGDSRRRALDVIERQSGHMTSLVEGLLEIGRAANGKMQLHPRAIDLGALLQELVADRDAQLSAAGVRCRVDLEPGPLTVFGDRTRLLQIFDNLLINAIKFTPFGGAIRVAARQRNGRVIASVEDSGIGIAADQLCAIFRPFIQARTAQRGLGLGIGLALTKLLVETHGGSIRADSDGLGKGSRFEVRLPTYSLGESPQPRESILIVAADEDVALILSSALRSSGHEVGAVSTGEEAVEAARRQRPQVVLVDLLLDGALDGEQVARAIRARPETCDALIIAMIQGSQRMGLDAAIFDGGVARPASLDEVERTIREASSSRIVANSGRSRDLLTHKFPTD